jgi:hypothetical protein
METGARSIGPRREHQVPVEQAITDPDLTGSGYRGFDAGHPAFDDQPPDPETSSLSRGVPAACFFVLAAGWISAVVWSITGAVPMEALSPLRIISWICLATGPLALLGIVWMLATRSGRGELRRYARVARAMRIDSENLSRTLSVLSQQIEENRRELEAHNAQLTTLGEDSLRRFSGIGEELRQETLAFARHAELIEGSTAAARADIGIMLTDLPQADAQTRAMAEALRNAGVGAAEQAASLETRLAALSDQARQTEEQTGSAAGRLIEHFARIEGGSAAASRRLEQASAEMARTVDGALAGTAQAVEETRRGVASQGEAMIAMVEQARAGLEQVGSDSTDQLAARLERIGARLEGFAVTLAGQDDSSRAALSAFEQALERIERKFEALGQNGAVRAAELSEAMTALGGLADHVGRKIEDGTQAADILHSRLQLLRGAIESGAQELEATIPAGLDRLRVEAERGIALLSAATPQAEGLAALVAETGNRLGEAGVILERHRRIIDSTATGIGSRLTTLREQAESLNGLLGDSDAAARQLAESAGGSLLDSLLRVRDTAHQAAERAREALGAVIPAAADELGLAAGQAMQKALADLAQTQLAAIAQTAEEAVGAANHASERLMRQMLTIAETSSTIERRINEAREDTERHDRQGFSRQVSLLIESLNSTAIDVAKILSNEVTDSAWAAYLRGDRGIFTRRAVRLIDAGEARAIAGHYGEDAEFREQVNRYVHDFEAMLRRVLASRDGKPLAVTILSSDMGKLYVALAHAIERLRV